MQLITFSRQPTNITTHSRKLTYTADSEQPSGVFGRRALREHGLEDVGAECQGDDRLAAGPHDHALDPEPHERHERAEGLHDVRVVRAGLAYHAAELRVAVRTDLRQKKKKKKIIPLRTHRRGTVVFACRWVS